MYETKLFTCSGKQAAQRSTYWLKKELQVIPEIYGTRNSEKKVEGGGFTQLIEQRHSLDAT
jgi:hypothetical protein